MNGTAAPVQEEDKILGLQKNVFAGLIIFVVVIIILLILLAYCFLSKNKSSDYSITV